MISNKSKTQMNSQTPKGEIVLISGTTTLYTKTTTASEGGVKIRYVIYDNGRENVQIGEVSTTFSNTLSDGPVPLTHNIDQIVGENTVAEFTASIASGVITINVETSEYGWSMTHEVIETLIPCMPIIRMTIAGLGTGKTWKGLGNGIHLLYPDKYNIRTRNASPDAMNTESWSSGAINDGYIPAGSYDGKFKFKCIQILPTGKDVTYATFSINTTSTLIGFVNSWNGSAAYSAGTGCGDLSGKYGHLKDTMLNTNGTISGITFSWERLPDHPNGIWGNY